MGNDTRIPASQAKIPAANEPDKEERKETRVVASGSGSPRDEIDPDPVAVQADKSTAP